MNATDKLSEEESVINFNELNDKALVFINEDGQSFSIITCAPKNSDIYLKLDSLFNSGAKFGDEKGQHVNIPDYQSMVKNEEFLEIIKKIVDSKEEVQNMKKKLGSYVFNADNFFKMVQILIRFRTGIPVLIMGETGCGKTSLINAIAEINNYKMLTFNVHAGVTDNEIVQFMVKHNLLEKTIGYDKYEDDVENLYNFDNENDSNSLNASVSNLSLDTQRSKIKENDNNKDDEQLIIVFFDEFNTCNSLGLLTEIMCSKKCQGVNVRKNVVFAGACNPYRKITKKPKDTSALVKEGSAISEQKLVYTVNPLTYTQLYYIFNFGSLSAENEKKYITGIVEAEINEYINDKSLINKIKLLMIDTFTSAQSFIKDKNGKESVSMRETRKFMTIYKFLIKDFERKKKISHIYSNKSELQKSLNAEEDYTFYLNKDEFLAQKYSIATAIYICFYIRLSESKDKTDFETEMNKLFELNFTEYPKQLQDELIRNIKLDKGIAPNEALRLNLFICFIGILTRISVFLVGPPGCSKTLCFNLLKREMKGYHSKSKFWQQYPQLVVTSY
jgi:energy-coupling factor transporter ATP-binding protein EcfA2